MLNRLFLGMALLATMAPAKAQDDGPIKMTPEFALTFPVVQNGKDVTVKYPVLMNRTTVLTPGMILRTAYVIHYKNDDDPTNLTLAHKGNMEQSFSRSNMSSDEQEKMPPELSHEIEGYRRTIWEVANNFELALAQLPTDSLHIIYEPTGKSNKLADDKFNFFDGLMVGLPDGKVTALAVENGSKADEAGIKAGDEIVSVGDLPTRNDLNVFSAVYATAKKNAKDNNADSYSITIRSGGDVRTVKIGMPPTIKSGLMNGF